MCYDVAKLLSRIKKTAGRKGYTPSEIEESVTDIKRQWQGISMIHLSAFTHPLLPLVAHIQNQPGCRWMRWGLVPPYVHEQEKANNLRKMTVNCQAESVFEKPSFRQSIVHHRAVLPVNGWFEHHHVGKHSYPYFIHDCEDELLYLGCIYASSNIESSSSTEFTFSIVTTVGNELLQGIHNRPAQGQGARMPLLLSGQALLEWLHPSTSTNRLKELMMPASDEYLTAYTVKPIHGKQANPQDEQVLDPVDYPELGAQQLSLF